MSTQLELVKRLDNKIVYRIDNLTMLTTDFILALQWPEKINVINFIFRCPIENEDRVLAGLPYSPDVGVVYSMRKSKTLTTLTGDTVLQVKAPGVKELAKMYLACRDRVFAHVPEKILPAIDMPAVLVKMENQIKSAKIGYWEVKARPAGAIVVTRLANNADAAVEWVPWVWIDDNLLAEERRLLHARIRAWLTENIDQEVQCVVNSFNVRSQKFFRKMGFVPECVRIVKS